MRSPRTTGSESSMLAEYLPVMVFIGVGVVVGVVLMLVGWLIGPSRPDPEKLSPYECGFEPFEDSRMKFDVRYYIVAILLIIFDLEIAFMFPWAVALDSIGLFGLRHMGGRPKRGGRHLLQPPVRLPALWTGQGGVGRRRASACRHR